VSLKALGYSKADVKKTIWETARIPLADWEEMASDYMEGGRANPEFSGLWARYIESATWLKPYTNLPLATLVPIAASPNNFAVVVAAGELVNHWTWFVDYPGENMKIIEIKTPKNWADLVKKAPKFWEGAGF
jgi:hypothetical protein